MPNTDHAALYYHDHARKELVAATKLTQVELTKKLVTMNLELIAKAPINYLTMVAKAVGWICLPYVSPSDSFGKVGQLAFSVLQLGVVLLYFLVLAVLVTFKILYGSLASAEERWLGKNNSLLMLCSMSATIVLYTVGLSCLLEAGSPRYRVPVDPLIVVSVLSMSWFVFKCRTRKPGSVELPEYSVLLDDLDTSPALPGRATRPASIGARQIVPFSVEKESL